MKNGAWDIKIDQFDGKYLLTAKSNGDFVPRIESATAELTRLCATQELKQVLACSSLAALIQLRDETEKVISEKRKGEVMDQAFKREPNAKQILNKAYDELDQAASNFVEAKNKYLSAMDKFASVCVTTSDTLSVSFELPVPQPESKL